MNDSLLKQLGIAFLVVVVLCTISFLFIDKHAAMMALQLKKTWAHEYGVLISQLSNHNLIYFVIGFGALVSGINLLGDNPRPWARDVMYICVSVCVAVVIMECVKFIFGRCRPQLFFDKQEYGFTWFTGKYLKNSFPSGHTVRIFALCTALGLVFRKALLPLLGVAALVGVSRVLALKHYPSDVMMGAYVGATVAIAAYVIWNRKE